MNEKLEHYAREQLKKSLQKVTEEQRLMFKRMYSHQDLDKHINQVVDDMSEDKLDWAMQQVAMSLQNNAKNK